MSPLISVLLCVKNAEVTIDYAIKSILWQTEANWEFLILDDGSTDSTLEKIKGYSEEPRISIFQREKSQGLAAGLNFLLSHARGKYIARMDADDISMPHRFACQLSYLERNTEVDLVASSVIMFGENYKPLGKFPVFQSHSEIVKRANQGFFMPHPTWMGKREWFLKYGYDESLKRAQDQDLLQRSYRSSYFFCISEPLLGYSQIDMTLTKRLKGRYHQVLFRYKYSTFGQFVQAFGAHTLKSVADVIFWCSGFKNWLLQRWGVSLEQKERESWENCVQQLVGVSQ